MTAEWRWPHGHVWLYTWILHHNPNRQYHSWCSELIRLICSVHVTHCEVLIYKVVDIVYKNVNWEHVWNHPDKYYLMTIKLQNCNTPDLIINEIFYVIIYSHEVTISLLAPLSPLKSHKELEQQQICWKTPDRIFWLYPDSSPYGENCHAIYKCPMNGKMRKYWIKERFQLSFKSVLFGTDREVSGSYIRQWGGRIGIIYKTVTGKNQDHI